MIHNVLLNRLETHFLRPFRDLKNWLKYPPSKSIEKNLYFFLHWLKSFNRNFDMYTPYLPWMTYRATAWLDDYLKDDFKVFEWGSGMSTLYLLTKVAKVVSVEHDKGWYQRISNEISILHTNKNRIDYLLIAPQKISTQSQSYRSHVSEYKQFSFEKYCKAINGYPDQSFDLVIVDGRARQECTILAYNKVKQNGYILIDNSERKEYQQAAQKLIRKGCKARRFIGYGPQSISLTETLILKVVHKE